MDIMTQLRTWTPDQDQGRTDFDDLTPVMPAKRMPKPMIRIVPGADDLKPALPNMGGGSGTYNPAGHVDTRPIIAEDGRTPRQTEVMQSLQVQISELDAELGRKALEYTAGMTEHGRWTQNENGVKGTASVWIGNMIAKVRELKAAARTAPVATTPTTADTYADIPSGYYALHGDPMKFYRVKHGKGQWTGRTFVDACASDARYPIRNPATRTSVLDGIRAMGWQASTALYGSELGHCGKCHRELTDETSRTRGIGPECWKKM